MNALAPINAAQLPRTYEAARAALAECSAVDECKDWADKAAALASYARQSQDDQLEKMANRIRARATRRAGELLKQIEPAKTGPKAELGVGDHTEYGRDRAARDAGMSKHQQVQATRIANVPEDDFEDQVESEKPPTLSQLAQQGMQKRPLPPQPIVDLKGRDPREFKAVWSEISRFFTVDGGIITNARLLKEHKKAQKKSEARAIAGKAGGHAKALKDKAADSGNCHADAMASSSDTRVKKEEANASLSSDDDQSLDAHPIDEIAEAVSAYNVSAEAAGWPRVRALSKQRRASLRARLRDCGGLSGWDAALARTCRRGADRRGRPARDRHRELPGSA